MFGILPRDKLANYWRDSGGGAGEVSVRTKVSLIALPIVLASSFVFLWFFPVGRGPLWMLVYLVGFGAALNLIVIVAVRPFRCPHCGAHFGVAQL
jgi:hypothetical protein